MSGRSSVERLPPALRDAVDTAIEHGATIDEITARIRAGGGACSRSAVGRYVKRIRALNRRQQEIERVARAWARALGERSEGRAELLAIESLRTLALFCAADLGAGSEAVTAVDVGRLALALCRLDGSETQRARREHAAAGAAPTETQRLPTLPNPTKSPSIALPFLARPARGPARRPRSGVLPDSQV